MVTTAAAASAAFLLLPLGADQPELRIRYGAIPYTGAHDRLWSLVSQVSVGLQLPRDVALPLLALAVVACILILVRVVSWLLNTRHGASPQAQHLSEPQHKQQGQHAEEPQPPASRLSPSARVGGCVQLPSRVPALLGSAYRHVPKHKAVAGVNAGSGAARDGNERTAKVDVGVAANANANANTNARADGQSSSENEKNVSFRTVAKGLEGGGRIQGGQIEGSDEFSDEYDSLDESRPAAQPELGSQAKPRPSRLPPSPPKAVTTGMREPLPPAPARAPPVPVPRVSSASSASSAPSAPRGGAVSTRVPPSANSVAAVIATRPAAKARPLPSALPLPPSPSRAPPPPPAVQHAVRQREGNPSLAAKLPSSPAPLSITEQADAHLVEMARSSARAREVVARLRASLSARGSDSTDRSFRANAFAMTRAGAGARGFAGRASVPHSVGRRFQSGPKNHEPSIVTSTCTPATQPIAAALMVPVPADDSSLWGGLREGNAASLSVSPLQSAVAARAAADEASSVVIQAATASRLAVRMATAAAAAQASTG